MKYGYEEFSTPLNSLSEQHRALVNDTIHSEAQTLNHKSALPVDVVYAPHEIRIVRRDATLALKQSVDRNKRPFIHPIVMPSGSGVLTEDSPSHHPWQHGLYTGLNDVNGVGFWTEGLHKQSEPTDGRFSPIDLEHPIIENNRINWSVVCYWKNVIGDNLLKEEQNWHFSDFGDHYLLDVEWSITALVDLVFGQYAYGGLFLRTPYRNDTGVLIANSLGETNRLKLDGSRANWLALSLPLEQNQHAGIAILSHPSNPYNPMPWRVDNTLGICPSRCIAGSWELSASCTAMERYRLFIFPGQISTPSLEQQWQRYAKTERGTS